MRPKTTLNMSPPYQLAISHTPHHTLMPYRIYHIDAHRESHISRLWLRVCRTGTDIGRCQMRMRWLHATGGGAAYVHVQPPPQPEQVSFDKVHLLEEGQWYNELIEQRRCCL